MDSILESVKDYLGVSDDVTAYDTEILMAINAVMIALKQFGIGPEEGYVVEGTYDTWDDLMGDNHPGGVREYVCMRVRMLFDPPSNNQIMAALKEQISEFEWRILDDADRLAEEGEDE